MFNGSTRNPLAIVLLAVMAGLVVFLFFGGGAPVVLAPSGPPVWKTRNFPQQNFSVMMPYLPGEEGNFPEALSVLWTTGENYWVHAIERKEFLWPDALQGKAHITVEQLFAALAIDNQPCAYLGDGVLESKKKLLLQGRYPAVELVGNLEGDPVCAWIILLPGQRVYWLHYQHSSLLNAQPEGFEKFIGSFRFKPPPWIICEDRRVPYCCIWGPVAGLIQALIRTPAA